MASRRHSLRSRNLHPTLFFLALLAMVSGCASATHKGDGSETHFVTCSTDDQCTQLGIGRCIDQKCERPISGQESGGAAGIADANLGERDIAVFGCNDLSQLSKAPVISFENDLMPIFGLSCIASSCHDSTARKADLILGDPSACGLIGTSCYDPSAKWRYTFPNPIPRALLTTVYSGLVNVPSKTVPAVKLVTPGDSTSSFLLDTVMGTQNSNWYTPQCQSQDTTRPGACGGDMPLGSSNFCVEAPDKVLAIAAWIDQGAQMN